jgi:Raf kinase inhibitor-like YbhB/YbcL family protein
MNRARSLTSRCGQATLLIAAFVVPLAPSGCGDHQADSDQPAGPDDNPPEPGGVPMMITLASPAFEADSPIPEKYTADGIDVSPPLEWSKLPQGTQEVALIMDDPDAPRDEPFVHWVIYGIPNNARGLPEGLPPERTLTDPVTAQQGRNDFTNVGYGGPAPPPGHGTHHYHFKLYALGRTSGFEPGLTKEQLLDAMQGRILAQGELVGTYER